MSYFNHISSTFFIVSTIFAIFSLPTIENFSSSRWTSLCCVFKTWNWALSYRVSNSRGTILNGFVKNIPSSTFTCSNLTLSKYHIAFLYISSTLFLPFQSFFGSVTSNYNRIFVVHICRFLKLYNRFIIASMMLNICKWCKFSIWRFIFFMLSFLHSWILRWCFFTVDSIVLVDYRFFF